MSTLPNRNTSGPLATPDQPQPPARRRSLGLRLLGWTLLTASLGLLSCQSLFLL